MSRTNGELKVGQMISWLILAGLVLPQSSWPRGIDNERENHRVQSAGTVMNEILNVPDDIPRDLLDKARCVIVLPSVLKAAFVVGADYGRGVMTCRTGRDFRGGWGAPTMMALEGGSFGLQIGGEATDFVILVMNNRGAESLLHSKVKLGGDAAVAAGPMGRDAQADTDIAMRAEMLSYSRSRGVFAGVSLEGSTLRPDTEANTRLYGRNVSASEIITESKVAAPESAHILLRALRGASPQLKS
jgi:SH3 domain-containing YSC84-like protein 1